MTRRETMVEALQDGVLLVAEWDDLPETGVPGGPRLPGGSVRLIRVLTPLAYLNYTPGTRLPAWESNRIHFLFEVKKTGGQWAFMLFVRIHLPGSLLEHFDAYDFSANSTTLSIVHGPFLWLVSGHTRIHIETARYQLPRLRIPVAVPADGIKTMRHGTFSDIAWRAGWPKYSLQEAVAIKAGVRTWWKNVQVMARGPSEARDLGHVVNLGDSRGTPVRLDINYDTAGEYQLELQIHRYGPLAAMWPGLLYLKPTPEAVIDALLRYDVLVADNLDSWLDDFIPEPNYIAFEELNELRELLNDQPVWMDSNEEVLSTIKELSRV